MKKIAFLCITIFTMALICVFGCRAVHADDEVKVDNGIPVVYINIDESQGTIEDMLGSYDHSVYCYGTISIDVPEGFSYSDFEDAELESIEEIGMSIRGRGNSTWTRTIKRPFKVKLDTKTDILGLGANKHWVLVANALDSSLLKDRITGWLGDQMGFDFTPRGVPVDLVITGETYGTHYLGSYYLSENVRVDDNRLEIAELDEDDDDPLDITGGYLLQNSLQVSQDSLDRFVTSRGAQWATNTPSFDTDDEECSLEADEEDAFAGAELGDAYKNSAQQEYIQNYIQEFEDVLYEDGTAYRELMDVENAAKYWLVNMVSKNQDAYVTSSTYLYKDRDTEDGVSKLYWGPLWDFDFAWNYNLITTGFSYGHDWMKPLFYDKEEGGFVAELHKQWPEFKELLEKLIEDGGVIDQYYEETRLSAEADYKLYHEGYDYEDEEEFDYKNEVEKLKTWIRERIDWVDENFDLLDDMVHKVTFIVDGEKYASDYLALDECLTGNEKYPEKSGYTFLGWADEDGNIIDSVTYFTEDITLTAEYIADSEVSHAVDIALRKDSDIIGYNAFFSVYAIRYEVIPADAFDKTVEWTSSDESVATVDEEGIVRFYCPGEVTFTAKLKMGKTRTFKLTITEGSIPCPESIYPVDDVMEMTAGQVSALYINTNPASAKIYEYAYSSDDESVVSVDEFGAVTANGVGRTIVRIRAVSYNEDGEEVVLETSVTVVVKETESEPETSPDSVPDAVPDVTPDASPDAAPESETKADQSAQSTSKKASDVPKTGDNLMFWIEILAAAALILGAGIFVKRNN